MHSLVWEYCGKIPSTHLTTRRDTKDKIASSNNHIRNREPLKFGSSNLAGIFKSKPKSRQHRQTKEAFNSHVFSIDSIVPYLCKGHDLPNAIS